MPFYKITEMNYVTSILCSYCLRLQLQVNASMAQWNNSLNASFQTCLGEMGNLTSTVILLLHHVFKRGYYMIAPVKSGISIKSVKQSVFCLWDALNVSVCCQKEEGMMNPSIECTFCLVKQPLDLNAFRKRVRN